MSNEDDDIVNIGFGEKTNRNRLILMDVVSGLADKSKKFASFLTVTRKFSYTCIYIFSQKSIWRTIISQTNIFNIFLANVSLASVEKILVGVCRSYIPQSALWISRLFIELANRDDRVCLTLDCSGINKDGPGRFRTEADKPDFQTCYFNLANDEQAYNEFVSKQINESELNNRIEFKIIHLRSKTNREENFDAMEELRDLTKNNGTTTSGSKKKRARTIFGSCTKSVEKYNAGHGKGYGATPKFLLG